MSKLSMDSRSKSSKSALFCGLSASNFPFGDTSPISLRISSIFLDVRRLQTYSSLISLTSKESLSLSFSAAAEVAVDVVFCTTSLFTVSAGAVDLGDAETTATCLTAGVTTVWGLAESSLLATGVAVVFFTLSGSDFNGGFTTEDFAPATEGFRATGLMILAVTEV